MLKLFLLIICLSFSANCFCQDTINWRSSYKLKWDDFKATPDTFSALGAISSINITFERKIINSKPLTKVYCYFRKDRSWSKHKDDSFFINHEQGHFDIGELYARLLRKAISTQQLNDKELDSVFQNLTVERKKYNDLYDTETDLSRNKPKQILWNNKILLEIKKLDQYRE